jgi:hypothetical protein
MQSMLRWLLIFVALAAAVWWLAVPEPVASVSAGITTRASGCPLPSRRVGDDGALQSDAPGGMARFTVGDASAEPLAGFSIAARVLAREDYDDDREARYAPLDLALAWGRMRDDQVLSQLDISQSGRFYRYRWSGEPPLPPDELVRSSANMHLIPADASVRAALDGIDADDRVRIDGWLVQVRASDGWQWRSSLTREDAGAGACELIYVCAVTRL